MADLVYDQAKMAETTNNLENLYKLEIKKAEISPC